MGNRKSISAHTVENITEKLYSLFGWKLPQPQHLACDTHFGDFSLLLGNEGCGANILQCITDAYIDSNVIEIGRAVTLYRLAR